MVAKNIAQLFAKQIKIRRQGFLRPGRFSCTHTNAFKKTPRVYLTRQVFLHVTPDTYANGISRASLLVFAKITRMLKGTDQSLNAKVNQRVLFNIKPHSCKNQNNLEHIPALTI